MTDPYLGAGIVLLVYPLEGVVTLTLVLAAFLLLEGVFELILAFQLRPNSSNWWWVLADGIVTLVLGLLIWLEWPASAAWVIGLLLGISLISSGLSRLMLSIAVRSALNSKSEMV
ncbi:HdeD family acid-resistance protein [Myxosarcina sp. GI1(2024)]